MQERLNQLATGGLVGFVLNPLVHYVVAAIIVIFIFAWAVPKLHRLRNPPKPPTGWSSVRDYDATRLQRKSVTEYLATQNKTPANTMLTQLNVATANFGGIFTEDGDYIGTVSPDAARLQVDAGARAIVLDVWPDPMNRTEPVVCSMMDTTQWPVLSWWKNTGKLNQGVGRYSNWQLLTRNKAPLRDIVAASVQAAFTTGTPVNPTPTPTADGGLEDPFFLILNLHGAINTSTFLNKVGGIVQAAVGARKLSSDYIKANAQGALCRTPIASFLGRVTVITNVDFQSGFANDTAFSQMFFNSTLGEATNVTNVMNASNPKPATLVIDPTSVGMLTTPNFQDCSGAGSNSYMAQSTLVVVQPSIGGKSPDNDTIYTGEHNFFEIAKAGAQFVAVNLFSSSKSDATLDTFFSDNYFNTYSFAVSGK